MILLNFRKILKDDPITLLVVGKDDIAHAPRKVPTLIIYINSQVRRLSNNQRLLKFPNLL